MKLIPLTQGKSTIVDDWWYEYLCQWKWYLSSMGYAVRNSSAKERLEGAPFLILMHRVIMGLPVKQQIDHWDTDPLNNQYGNLRISTQRQNLMNAKKRKNASSKYKGVYWGNREQKWIGQIVIDGKKKQTGTFETEEEGALVYNQFATKYFGEFAKLNIIEGATNVT